MARGDAFTGFNHNFSRARLDIKIELLAAQPLRNKIHLSRFGKQGNSIIIEKHAEDLFRRIIERFKDNRCRQLTPTINTDKEQILLVELKIQPGSAVRDHPSVE